jgi:hypothetical protein
MAAIVAPVGDCSIAITRDCLEAGLEALLRRPGLAASTALNAPDCQSFFDDFADRSSDT